MRRNEEIKVCCCLTYKRRPPSDECCINYKNRNHNHSYEGIQLDNESWSIEEISVYFGVGKCEKKITE